MKKVLFIVPLLVMSVAFGQRKKEVTASDPAAPNAIQSKVAGMQAFAGFFEFYYDVKQDKILLVIDKFDSEFLYINSLTAGVGSNDIGLDRGGAALGRWTRWVTRAAPASAVAPAVRTSTSCWKPRACAVRWKRPRARIALDPGSR